MFSIIFSAKVVNVIRLKSYYDSCKHTLKSVDKDNVLPAQLQIKSWKAKLHVFVAY